MPETVLTEKRWSENEVVALELIPGIRNRITLFRKRKKNLIGFFKVGNRIFYGQRHIEEFLARCERKAKGGAPA